MHIIKFFLCFLVFFSLNIQPGTAVDTIICDPMQAIVVNMRVSMEDPLLQDLQRRGIQELSLTPAGDSSWVKTFPLENGVILTLEDTADPLALDMREGLLVTYKSCEDDIIYAYCQIPPDDLKGRFPKDVVLHLNPVLNKCNIEIICTQCP